MQIYFPQLEKVNLFLTKLSLSLVKVFVFIGELRKGVFSAFSGQLCNRFMEGARTNRVIYFLAIMCIQVKITIEILRLRYYQSRWVYFWRETAPNISMWWWLLIVLFSCIYIVCIYVLAYFFYIYFNTVVWHPRVLDTQFLYKNKTRLMDRIKRLKRRKRERLPKNIWVRRLFFWSQNWPITKKERRMRKYFPIAIKPSRRQKLETYFFPNTKRVRADAYKRHRIYMKEVMHWTYWRYPIMVQQRVNKVMHLLKTRRAISKKHGWRRFIRVLSAFRPNMYLPKKASHADGRWTYVPLLKTYHRVLGYYAHDIRTFSGPGMKLFWFFNTSENQMREPIIKYKKKLFRKLLIQPWNRFWPRKKPVKAKKFPYRDINEYYYPPFNYYAIKRVQWWLYRLWVTYYQFGLQKFKKYRRGKKKRRVLYKKFALAPISKNVTDHSRMFGNTRTTYNQVLAIKPYILMFIWFTIIYIFLCIWICVFIKQLTMFYSNYHMQKKEWFHNKRISDVEDHREDIWDNTAYEYNEEQFRLEQTWQYWIDFMQYFVHLEAYAIYKRDEEPSPPYMMPDYYNVLGGVEYYFFFDYWARDFRGLKRRFKYLIWKNFYMKWSFANLINYHKCRMRELRYVHKRWPETSIGGRFFRMLNWVINCIDMSWTYGWTLMKIFGAIFIAGYMHGGRTIRYQLGGYLDKATYWQAPAATLFVFLVILLILLFIKPIPYHNLMFGLGEWHPEWVDVENEGDPDTEVDIVDWEALEDETHGTIHTDYWTKKTLRRVFWGAEWYPWMYPDSVETELMSYDVDYNWNMLRLEMEDGREPHRAKAKYFADMTEDEKKVWYKKFHRATAYMRVFSTPYHRQWQDIERHYYAYLASVEDYQNNVRGARETGLTWWKNKHV